MQLTVQIGVVFLNLGWIFFFFQPDPLAVFVQKRSSETAVKFCLQSTSEMTWTTPIPSEITSTPPSKITWTSPTPSEITSTPPSKITWTSPTPSEISSTPPSQKTWKTPIPSDKITSKPQSKMTWTRRVESGNINSKINVLKECCTNFYRKRIKIDLIRSYYMTTNQCSKTGIILVTARSHICVDPADAWVQSVRKTLDKKSS
ncbi:C-C motif chemokine 14 Chemokine CC-1/CC-3 [Channa argus]|uniref:C-C motif chemokine n=1 Tax=Channa argus TaxID=215402 RepID=A0A6G1Q4W2_CHAAH|nr:C-C motif chemokine 14 Chemokine CC-1/CC-3 [Channa argus]